MPTIGRNTHPMVATSGFHCSPEPPLLGNMRGIVPLHCNGHQTASKMGVLFDCCFVDCCPGGRWGNMEQVVARCRRPGASGVAMDMPHRAMPSVLLRRTSMAVKTAGR
jgi:hypothetical protein